MGDITTAFTSLDIEDSTAVDASVRSVEVRIVREDETDLVPWLKVADGAAGGTTWPVRVRGNVPASSGLLEVEVRAKNASGIVVGSTARSIGLHSTCVVMATSHAQSHHATIRETHVGDNLTGKAEDRISTPSGMRLVARLQKDDRTYQHILAAADHYDILLADRRHGPSTDRWQVAVESHALFPGIPVLAASSAQVGTSPFLHSTAGATHGQRTARLRAHRGLPTAWYYPFMFGHSSISSRTKLEVQQALVDTVALLGSNLGTAHRVLVAHVSGNTTSLSEGGANGDGNDWVDSWDAFRDHALANSPKAFLCGDWFWILPDSSPLGSVAATDSGGHPERSMEGMGQFEAMIVIPTWPLATPSPTAPASSRRPRRSGSRSS